MGVLTVLSVALAAAELAPEVTPPDPEENTGCGIPQTEARL